MVRSGKNLIGQVNSQILSDQTSCKLSATFSNTIGQSGILMKFVSKGKNGLKLHLVLLASSPRM